MRLPLHKLKGYAMAEYFVSLGKKVIITGRTQSKLQEASQKLAGNPPFYTFDTGEVELLPQAVKRILADHPDVDCLVNNAGVQRPLDVNNLALDKVDNEINIVSLFLLPH